MHGHVWLVLCPCYLPLLPFMLSTNRLRLNRHILGLRCNYCSCSMADACMCWCSGQTCWSWWTCWRTLRARGQSTCCWAPSRSWQLRIPASALARRVAAEPAKRATRTTHQSRMWYARAFPTLSACSRSPSVWRHPCRSSPSRKALAPALMTHLATLLPKLARVQNWIEAMPNLERKPKVALVPKVERAPDLQRMLQGMRMSNIVPSTGRCCSTLGTICGGRTSLSCVVGWSSF